VRNGDPLTRQREVDHLREDAVPEERPLRSVRLLGDWEEEPLLEREL
jgi:hypothetical protein